MLEWGKHAARLAKIPDSPAWKNQPVLQPRLIIVMKALDDLASSRGDAGIPFAAISAYAAATGLDVFWLTDRLMPVDRAILKHHADKLETKRGKNRHASTGS